MKKLMDYTSSQSCMEISHWKVDGEFFFVSGKPLVGTTLRNLSTSDPYLPHQVPSAPEELPLLKLDLCKLFP